MTADTWNTSTEYSTAHDANAPHTHVAVESSEVFATFVSSHRYESGWEAVRQLLQAIGILTLMFLLALVGILSAFAFVLWVQ